MMIPKDINVYVTNDFGYDLSDAKRYIRGDGEIISITEGRVSIQQCEKVANKMMYSLNGMKETDYLLISGNSVVASLASSIVFNKFKRLNLLVFDAREHKYNAQTIILDNLGNVGKKQYNGNLKDE